MINYVWSDKNLCLFIFCVIVFSQSLTKLKLMKSQIDQFKWLIEMILIALIKSTVSICKKIKFLCDTFTSCRFYPPRLVLFWIRWNKMWQVVSVYIRTYFWQTRSNPVAVGLIQTSSQQLNSRVIYLFTKYLLKREQVNFAEYVIENFLLTRAWNENELFYIHRSR